MQIAASSLNNCTEINFNDYNAIEMEVHTIGLINVKCKPGLWQGFLNIFRSKENKKCG